jgi:hypothetical protein
MRALKSSHQYADDYVIDPLRTIPGDPVLASAVSEYQAAPEKRKAQWDDAYAKPLDKYETAIDEKKASPKTVTLDPSTGAVAVQASGTGPVPRMMAGLLGLATTGGLDGTLLTSNQSSRPTTPSRCCSWLTAVCSPNARKRVIEAGGGVSSSALLDR